MATESAAGLASLLISAQIIIALLAAILVLLVVALAVGVSYWRAFTAWQDRVAMVLEDEQAARRLSDLERANAQLSRIGSASGRADH